MLTIVMSAIMSTRTRKTSRLERSSRRMGRPRLATVTRMWTASMCTHGLHRNKSRIADSGRIGGLFQLDLSILGHVAHSAPSASETVVSDALASQTMAVAIPADVRRRLKSVAPRSAAMFQHAHHRGGSDARRTMMTLTTVISVRRSTRMAKTSRLGWIPGRMGRPRLATVRRKWAAMTWNHRLHSHQSRIAGSGRIGGLFKLALPILGHVAHSAPSASETVVSDALAGQTMAVAILAAVQRRLKFVAPRAAAMFQ